MWCQGVLLNIIRKVDIEHGTCHHLPMVVYTMLYLVIVLLGHSSRIPHSFVRTMGTPGGMVKALCVGGPYLTRKPFWNVVGGR